MITGSASLVFRFDLSLKDWTANKYSETKCLQRECNIIDMKFIFIVIMR